MNAAKDALESTPKDATREDDASRLVLLSELLATFPDSVAQVSYALDGPPPLAPLGLLLQKPTPALTRFVQRLKKARPDLSAAELLQLPVPVSPGDQEVYSARLGKWLFEKQLLERAA